jgi:hypothetical protein
MADQLREGSVIDDHEHIVVSLVSVDEADVFSKETLGFELRFAPWKL